MCKARCDLYMRWTYVSVNDVMLDLIMLTSISDEIGSCIDSLERPK